MFKFNIGDEVNYIREFVKYKCIVRVLPSRTDDVYAIELLSYPGPSAGFVCHTCDGYVPSGFGQWVYEESLEWRHSSVWPPKESRHKYKGFEKCTQLKS